MLTGRDIVYPYKEMVVAIFVAEVVDFFVLREGVHTPDLLAGLGVFITIQACLRSTSLDWD